jgi:hypothetical protein
MVLVATFDKCCATDYFKATVAMKPRPTSGYIWIGAGVRFLVDVNVAMPVFQETYVVPTIGIVLRYLDEYELLVTRRVAKQPETMHDGWLTELRESTDE